MIATKDSFETGVEELLPNSRRVYLSGRLHPDIRVPIREIALSPTKSIGGRIEADESVRVYDCSGPWGDPSYQGDVEHGLPPLRREWILHRGDVQEVSKRFQDPKSKIHNNRKPFRASAGHPVTQLWYARQGI